MGARGERQIKYKRKRHCWVLRKPEVILLVHPRNISPNREKYLISLKRRPHRRPPTTWLEIPGRTSRCRKFCLLRTGLGPKLHEWKMTSRVLTTNSDHTRSRLHEKHHIRFLDSCTLTSIFWKTAMLIRKWKDFPLISKYHKTKYLPIWYFSKFYQFSMEFCIFWYHFGNNLKHWNFWWNFCLGGEILPFS